MALLTRDAILSASDIRKEQVECPEWGGSVWVRGLTGEERDAFELSIYAASQATKGKGVGRRHVRANLAARCVCDEAGALLFTPADIEALGAKSAAPLDRICEAANRLSGLSKADQDDLEKN